MGNSKWGGLSIIAAMATLMVILGCSSGGSGGREGPEPRDLMTVVVETNQDDASFVITDAEGNTHAGGGKTHSESIPAGSASIAFQSIEDFCTPGLQTLTGSTGDTIRFVANYDLGCSANLVITTDQEDAKFMLYGPENIYRGLGLEWTILGIPDGQYTLRFDVLDDACYQPPAMQTITMVAGSTEELSFSYEYDDTCTQEDYLYKDEDNDGYAEGTMLPADSSEDLSDYKWPSALISTKGDCDDSNFDENPGVTGRFCKATTWYMDADGDRYSTGVTKEAASPPSADYYEESELISTTGDCDDTDATINPGMSEVCSDRVDNDCDGDVDGDDADCAEPQTQTVFSEDFEASWGNWFADNGVWEVGTPTSGPDAAHSGSGVAGSVLAGDYPNTTSRLVSPNIELPAIGSGEEINLRFWQWFNFNSDVGDVEVSQQTSPGVWSDWTTLTTYNRSSGVWSNAMVDLSAYAGMTVRIGFQLRQLYSSVGPGWYVDDISIETRSTTILVAGGSYTYDFDQGIGDWFADNGVWEVGTPTSGPSAAHSGSDVAGTVLAGDYPNTTCRIVSPTIELPAIGSGEEIHLRFWQWFNFNSDVGDVQVSQQTSPGVWSDWTTLTTYNRSSGVWSNALVDLSAYAESAVRIGFQLRQLYSSVGPGWYVDDVLIEVN